MISIGSVEHCRSMQIHRHRIALKGVSKNKSSDGGSDSRDMLCTRAATGIAMGWTVRGSNPGGGEIFRIRPDRPWVPPSLLYDGYRVSSPELKRSGRGVDHRPPSRAEVKERVELSVSLLPVWAFMACYLFLLDRCSSRLRKCENQGKYSEKQYRPGQKIYCSEG